jgi:hypothetical protein
MVAHTDCIKVSKSYGPDVALKFGVAGVRSFSCLILYDNCRQLLTFAVSIVARLNMPHHRQYTLHLSERLLVIPVDGWFHG